MKARKERICTFGFSNLLNADSTPVSNRLSDLATTHPKATSSTTTFARLSGTIGSPFRASGFHNLNNQVYNGICDASLGPRGQNGGGRSAAPTATAAPKLPNLAESAICKLQIATKSKMEQLCASLAVKMAKKK